MSASHLLAKPASVVERQFLLMTLHIGMRRFQPDEGGNLPFRPPDGVVPRLRLFVTASCDFLSMAERSCA